MASNPQTLQPAIAAEVAKWLLQCFRGREDVLAVQNGNGFAPEPLTSPLTVERFAAQHLSGKTCLGFYVLNADDHVLASAPDLDNHGGSDPEWRSKTEQVYFALTKLGLSPIIEVSQSGEGSHVWLLFADPVPAWLVRRFWQVIEAASGVDFREINPKQNSRHATEKGLGNLVRFPLWNKSRFVDVENDWAECDPVQVLSQTPRLSLAEFRALCSLLKVPMDPPLNGNGKPHDAPFGDGDSSELPPRVAKLVGDRNTLLGRRWHGDTEGLKDASRSGLAHAIACGLVKRFIPTGEIATAIRVWGRQHSYENVERDGWIRTTLGNAYDFIGSLANIGVDEADSEPRTIEYERLTCAQLDAAEYETEYLIRDVLVAQQPMIFAGGKKQLKTSLMVDMAISLATGGYWLGKFKVSRALRVAMMSGESGLATLQETARRIAHAAGKELANIEGLIWSPCVPRFDSLQHLDALRRFLTSDEISVVMVDPAFLALPGTDASNLFIMGEMLRRVSELCQSIGVGLILAHHTKKTGIADPYAPAELEHIGWAGFQEFARQWALLSRRRRYEPGSGRHELWLSLGGSAGHSGLWAVDVEEGVYSEDTPRRWDVDVRPPDEERTAVSRRQDDVKAVRAREKLDADKRALAFTLVKFPNGETKSILKAHAGMSGARVDAAMAALIDDGAVELVEIFKGGRRTPREGYKLANTETVD